MPKKKVTEAVEETAQETIPVEKTLHRCHAVRVVRIFLN